MSQGYASTSLVKSFDDQVALGNVPGVFSVNKFGRSTNVDNGIVTDIWDRANATDDQDIWVAPTEARTHNLVSTSTSDDGDPAGVGAQIVEISGLTSWSTAEVTETVTMNGTSNVLTSNAYVIIHRLIVTANGATSVNVGKITATATTDGTVTAQINAGEGRTAMAIYGIPSTQTLLISRLYSDLNKSAGVTGAVDISLRVNNSPDVQLLGFNIFHTFGIMSTGTSALTINFNSRKSVAGPAIIKIQGVGTANDFDVSSGFDSHLYDN